MGKTILIVDDDPAQRRLLQAAVERNGFRHARLRTAHKPSSSVDTHADIDCVLLDLVMPGMTGQEALKEIRMRRGDLPCIVLTASGGIDTVVQAMQAGATDFFVKPASPERIMVSIRNALEMSNLKTEVVRMKKQRAGQLSFDDMVANAPVMGPVVRMGKRAAASNIPVLITGESGVGKELLARCDPGRVRARRPSVRHGELRRHPGKPGRVASCSGTPRARSRARPTITPASSSKRNGGTLFLDEVGELPLDMQVKLLRVLQEGEVDPVGGKRPVKVDVRIISATNKDLAKLVADGRFREDLYYRLNVFPIEAPPLRERKRRHADAGVSASSRASTRKRAATCAALRKRPCRC